MINLMTLCPIQAALVQKEILYQVDPSIYIFAPESEES